MKQCLVSSGMKYICKYPAILSVRAVLRIALGLALVVPCVSYAKQPQPPAPCHPNPHAAEDRATVLTRGDVGERAEVCTFPDAKRAFGRASDASTQL